MRCFLAAMLVSNILALPVLAPAQGFNIDLDIFSGTPAQGNGTPSSSFGAAAGQAGYWNRVSAVVGGSFPILTISEISVGVSMTIEGATGFGLGFLNASNTGDFALLLNDSATVNAIGMGGNLRYTFSGLTEGLYEIYTYAVVPQGVYCETPVYVPQAISNPLQVVTGPMPGNAFEYLITHSIHRLVVDETGLIEVISQPPPATTVTSEINGLQIVPVPETNSAFLVGTGILYSLFWFRNRRENTT